MHLNPQNPELDEAVLAIAKRRYRRTPTLTKCHSQVNYCVILHFDSVIADRVIKLTHRYRWAIEVERLLYPEMRRHGLPVPEIEFTHLDDSVPSEPYIIMPKFSDHTLGRLCGSEVGAALGACERSGQFIHELHERFAEAFKPFLSVEEAKGQLAAIQDLSDAGPDFSQIHAQMPDVARAIESHFAKSPTPTSGRLTHGQLHTDNILARRKGEICVVDIGETIRMASPLQDLYMLLWSHDCWTTGADKREQRAALVRGYGGLADSALKELVYWEFRSCVERLGGEISSGNTGDSQKLVDRIEQINDGSGFLLL